MSRDRWIILSALFIVRTTLALQFQTIGSLGPELVQTFGIDYAFLGTLIGLYMLPGVFMALPGGLVGQRFGAQRTVMAGLAMMVLGGVLAGSPTSLLAVSVGRIISGIGAVILNVMLTKMITDWFAEREIVTAMSILISSWPLGIGIGLLTFPHIATAFGWTWVMHLTSGLLLLGLMLMAWLYRDPPSRAPVRHGPLDFHLTKRDWLLITLAGILWGTHNVAYIIFVSFTPALLVARGFSLVEANSLMSLVSWSLIVSIPLSGYLAERWRSPNLFMTTGLITATLAIGALVVTGYTIPYILVLILVIGWPAGLIMALPAEVLSPRVRATGMGVFYTWFYTTMATLPAVAGIAQDLTGKVSAPVLCAGILFFAAFVLAVVFRSVQHAFPRVREER